VNEFGVVRVFLAIQNSRTLRFSCIL